MKAAQEFVSEFNETTAPAEAESERTKRVLYMKPEINSLVLTALPDKTTVGEADVIANLILDIVLHPGKYLYP